MKTEEIHAVSSKARDGDIEEGSEPQLLPTTPVRNLVLPTYRALNPEMNLKSSTVHSPATVPAAIPGKDAQNSQQQHPPAAIPWKALRSHGMVLLVTRHEDLKTECPNPKTATLHLVFPCSVR